MKKIKVKSSKGDYLVYVGDNLLPKTGHLIQGIEKRIQALPEASGKVMIVSQENVSEHHLSPVYKSLTQAGFKVMIHLIPDGEEAKSQKELFRLHKELITHDFERKDHIVALGGGVVGDLAGFAASTYMRGIPFINIGTTLLAQVDSSIGGKTGINLEEGKNLVGTFYPAEVVISDIHTLSTLPDREFWASMAEVIKYGMIQDEALFSQLEKKSLRIIKREKDVLEEIVAACAKIKGDVVTKDEKETTGLRMILNYGHTFGHAFEKVLNYKTLLHGEGVALGMVCAARLAVLLNLMNVEDEARQMKLLTYFKLPTSLENYDISVAQVMDAMTRDKKKKAGKIRFVLPVGIGKVQIVEDASPEKVRQVLVSLGGKE